MLSDLGIPMHYTVNIIFVGKNKMKRVSEDYKKETETLPVLSFSYNEKDDNGKTLLGEVFICYPLAVLLAAERNRRVDEILKQLIKHGVENLLI